MLSSPMFKRYVCNKIINDFCVNSCCGRLLLPINKGIMPDSKG